jgi:hypothetical protein
MACSKASHILSHKIQNHLWKTKTSSNIIYLYEYKTFYVSARD